MCVFRCDDDDLHPLSQLLSNNNGVVYVNSRYALTTDNGQTHTHTPEIVCACVGVHNECVCGYDRLDRCPGKSKNQLGIESGIAVADAD